METNQSAAMEKVAGVYAVTCEANGRVYIGSTDDLDDIWYKTIGELEGGSHDNTGLSYDWDKYGGQVFSFEVLEDFYTYDKSELEKAKGYYIESNKSDDSKYGYNAKIIDAKPVETLLVDIGEVLDGYIGMRDQTLETSEQRLATMWDVEDEEYYIDTDDDLINWRSDQAFRNKNVKKKADHLTEDDFLMKKLEYMANYILHPNQKEYGILTNNQQKNVAREKPDETGYRATYMRELAMTDVVNEYGELTEDYAIPWSNHIETDTEQMMTSRDTVQADMSNISLANEYHIMTLLKLYNELQDLLDGREDKDNELRGVLAELDDAITGAKLDEVDTYIIELLRDKYLEGEQEKSYNYQQIEHLVNAKFASDYSYKNIVYRINSIPNKIAKAYHKFTGETIVKGNKPKVERLSKKEEAKRIGLNLFDAKAKKKNNEINKRYNSAGVHSGRPFSEVITYKWSKDKIDQYLLDTYGIKSGNN